LLGEHGGLSQLFLFIIILLFASGELNTELRDFLNDPHFTEVILSRESSLLAFIEEFID
jgi:hypothetical protein